MISAVRRLKKRFREYDNIAGISIIARRAFANNTFDGILTIMGIIIGSYIAGIIEPRIVIITGIGACIAMGVSGSWGAYFSEKAERKKQMLDLEKQTLRKLNNTKIEKAAKFATIIVAIVDGLSPFLGAITVLIPFFFVNGFSMTYAYDVSMVIAFIMLGLLGGFLGRLSKENVIMSSLKMVFAGVICIILSMVLHTF